MHYKPVLKKSVVQVDGSMRYRLDEITRFGSEPRFSEISELCSSLRIRDHVSGPHNTNRLFYLQTIIFRELDGMSTLYEITISIIHPSNFIMQLQHFRLPVGSKS